MKKIHNKKIISEQRKADFGCLNKVIEKKDYLFDEYIDRIVIYLEEIDLEANKNGRQWIFYKNTNDSSSGGRWFEFNGSTKVKDGRWYCDGENNFFYQTPTETYSSRTERSTPRTTTTEPTTTTTEPTTTTTEPTTTTTTTTDTNQSIFPLKKGISAPEVVQLQNFLNNKGTGEKLVTDGIFGDLTYNKLVKYQEDNNLI
jgi:hypothetical protein